MKQKLYDRATLVIEAKNRELGFADFLARLVRDKSPIARFRFAVACRAMDIPDSQVNLKPLSRSAKPVERRRGKRIIVVQGERGAVYGEGV